MRSLFALAFAVCPRRSHRVRPGAAQGGSRVRPGRCPGRGRDPPRLAPEAEGREERCTTRLTRDAEAAAGRATWPSPSRSRRSGSFLLRRPAKLEGDPERDALARDSVVIVPHEQAPRVEGAGRRGGRRRWPRRPRASREYYRISGEAPLGVRLRSRSTMRPWSLGAESVIKEAIDVEQGGRGREGDVHRRATARGSWRRPTSISPGSAAWSRPRSRRNAGGGADALDRSADLGEDRSAGAAARRRATPTGSP